MTTLVEERHITDEERARFAEDGAIKLAGVVSAEWLAVLGDGIAVAMRSPSSVSKAYGADKPGRFFTDHALFLRFEPFSRFIHESPLARLAAELMGAGRINLYDEHLLVKEPGADTPTWWHHDLPYFRIKGSQICSFWIPLDPVTATTGAPRFAIGSHRWGKLFRPVRIGEGVPVPESEDFDGPVPDIDGDPARYPTVCWDLEPGDCVVFHGAELHAASGNPSPTAWRRAISYRFTGDDITWHPGRFSPTDYNAPGLVEGGPLDSEIFPRLWTRPS